MQTIRTRALPTLLALTLLGATAGSALGQQIPETGGRFFGLVGGAFGDGNITPLVSGGAGIRITPNLGLDFEVLYAHDLGLPTDNDVIIQTFGAAFAPVERIERSRLVTFLTKMTVEFPVADGRVWPYLTGGGGVGNLRQTTVFRNLPLPLAQELGVQIFPPPDVVHCFSRRRVKEHPVYCEIPAECILFFVAKLDIRRPAAVQIRTIALQAAACGHGRF